jgi:hypothetical protein
MAPFLKSFARLQLVSRPMDQQRICRAEAELVDTGAPGDNEGATPGEARFHTDAKRLINKRLYELTY